ncbi:TTAGGG repeat binding factor [Coemansia sp. Benny D115]|nr:TTAGGG repeat binding factor [Coemansia sp. Benny D115]
MVRPIAIVPTGKKGQSSSPGRPTVARGRALGTQNTLSNGGQSSKKWSTQPRPSGLRRRNTSTSSDEAGGSKITKQVDTTVGRKPSTETTVGSSSNIKSPQAQKNKDSDVVVNKTTAADVKEDGSEKEEEEEEDDSEGESSQPSVLSSRSSDSEASSDESSEGESDEEQSSEDSSNSDGSEESADSQGDSGSEANAETEAEVEAASLQTEDTAAQNAMPTPSSEKSVEESENDSQDQSAASTENGQEQTPSLVKGSAGSCRDSSEEEEEEEENEEGVAGDQVKQGATADRDEDAGAVVLESVAHATAGTQDSYPGDTQAMVGADPLLADDSQHPTAAALQEERAEDNDEADTQALPVLGPSTPGDLLVLDYLSQRVIDELDTLCIQLNAAPSNLDFQRLDALAREHTLVRTQHFTRTLFLQNSQRPDGYTDIIQWANSLQRANLATFGLLVLRPEAVVVDRHGPMPNRADRLVSSGMAQAAASFFEHIVPFNRRNQRALSLLVDLQTQQWLAAATDDDELQRQVAAARALDDAGAARLLASDTSSNGPDPLVAKYRGVVRQRLNKISGGKLHLTRNHFKLAATQHRALGFLSECAQALAAPTLLGEPGADQSQDCEVRIYSDHARVLREAVASGLPASAVAEKQRESEKAASANVQRVAVFLRDTIADQGVDQLVAAVPSERPQITALLGRRSPTPSEEAVDGSDAGDNDSYRIEEPAELAEPAEPVEPQGRARRIVTALKRRRAAEESEEEYVSVSEGEQQQTLTAAAERMAQALKQRPKRGRIQYAQPNAGAETPMTPPQGFRGRRGIAAEDPATFEATEERISFTPSERGSPEAALGQYRAVSTPGTSPLGSPDGERQRQRRTRWTTAEEECFVAAVHTHGLRWSTILDYHGPNGMVDRILRRRTRVHLKDKARNIKIRLLRENKPLGPFANATGHL